MANKFPEHDHLQLTEVNHEILKLWDEEDLFHRSISEREGCTVYLCHAHHQDQRFGVHYDAKLMEFFKRDCQRRWERREGLEGEEAHEAFRRVFYESYL